MKLILHLFFQPQGDLKSIYSEKDFKIMTQLQKVIIDVNHEDCFHMYFDLIDIIVAFLYDLRTTELEFNSESGWTINKLSSVLSCFLSYKDKLKQESSSQSIIINTLTELLLNNTRRILTFPLYRNLKIVQKILKDLVYVMDKPKLLKCLLSIRSIFEKSDPRHLLNKLYIDNFIVWLEFSNENIWHIVKSNLKHISIKKEDIGLNLEEIEDMYEISNYDNEESHSNELPEADKAISEMI